MELTLNQAAKEVGKAKSTLSKAIKSGKLSAALQEDGSYRIDASELFRVFPPSIMTIPAFPEGNPKETIRRMQQVRKAALAPANPSSQDRSVAAQASREEAKARAELSNPKNQEDEKVKSGILSIYNKEYKESQFSVTA